MRAGKAQFLAGLRQETTSLSISNNIGKYANRGIQFHGKENPQKLKHFTVKNKGYYIFFLYCKSGLFYYHHQTVAMNHYCYCSIASEK